DGIEWKKSQLALCGSLSLSNPSSLSPCRPVPFPLPPSSACCSPPPSPFHLVSLRPGAIPALPPSLPPPWSSYYITSHSSPFFPPPRRTPPPPSEPHLVAVGDRSGLSSLGLFPSSPVPHRLRPRGRCSPPKRRRRSRLRRRSFQAPEEWDRSSSGGSSRRWVPAPRMIATTITSLRSNRRSRAGFPRQGLLHLNQH
ncbi:hypothetical protein Taro_019166, partial [Colocasia esculenta]|nr:hypothetical protein [Colocasia esculenta]